MLRIRHVYTRVRIRHGQFCSFDLIKIWFAELCKGGIQTTNDQILEVCTEWLHGGKCVLPFAQEGTRCHMTNTTVPTGTDPPSCFPECCQKVLFWFISTYSSYPLIIKLWELLHISPFSLCSEKKHSWLVSFYKAIPNQASSDCGTILASRRSWQILCNVFAGLDIIFTTFIDPSGGIVVGQLYIHDGTTTVPCVPAHGQESNHQLCSW